MMKLNYKKMQTQCLSCVMWILFSLSLRGQENVGIGTLTPDASAILELSASDKGILIPRLSAAQRLAIVNPATGLLVYDTDSSGFWYYNGLMWVQAIGPQGPAGPPGNNGLLPNGTAAGNTTFWNGTEWVVNNNNIYNNGAM